MMQSRLMSLVETGANVSVGFMSGIVVQAVLYPQLGLQVTIAINGVISAVFTVVSIVRSFVLRRLFETIRVRQQQKEASDDHTGRDRIRSE